MDLEGGTLPPVTFRVYGVLRVWGFVDKCPSNKAHMVGW